MVHWDNTKVLNYWKKVQIEWEYLDWLCVDLKCELFVKIENNRIWQILITFWFEVWFVSSNSTKSDTWSGIETIYCVFSYEN